MIKKILITHLKKTNQLIIYIPFNNVKQKIQTIRVIDYATETLVIFEFSKEEKERAIFKFSGWYEGQYYNWKTDTDEQIKEMLQSIHNCELK